MDKIICIDNIILQIFKQFNKNNFIFKKNIDFLKIISISKNFYNIYKSHFPLKCSLIKYPIIICKYHDNITQKYIDSLLYEVKKYLKNKHNPIIKDHMFPNITYLNIHNFIHIQDLQKHEIITNKILQNFNLKINKYCCEGNGASLINIY